VALVTGAARGQGRAHCLRLAQEGADIVALDIGADIDVVSVHLGTPEDLAATGALVEELDRRILLRQADVRDQAALDGVVADAVAEFGRIDIVVANAGIFMVEGALQTSEELWKEILDVDLTGVWRTIKAAAPVMIEGGRGGSIIITSSAAGLKGLPWMSAYSAAKHGLVGLMRTVANELGQYGIRVNSIHPGSVNTPMIMTETRLRELRPDLENPTPADVADRMAANTALNVGLLEPLDIANAALWLASDEARYVTGVALPVDAGLII
jgi:(+)-trans-carveol dehydrogenase/(-)-trans-carveol dehydrogenase